MTLELFLNRYFWLVPIGFSLWEILSWKSDIAEMRAQRPELIGTYKRFKFGEGLYFTVPWLVMGFGIFIGGTAGRDYFHPCSGKPFVIAFWLTVLLPVISMAVWIWFFGGAQYFFDLNETRSPLIIKLQSAGVLLFLFFMVGSACVMNG